MPHALEVISPDVCFISFPVTDGDSSRRPDNMECPPTSAREVNWHRTMTMEEKYSLRWRNLIGQGIAKLLNKPDKEKHCLQSFPEGYGMFDHNKGPISNIRHDIYLYGSKTALRFRSPAEFIPHGYWLLTDSTLNNKNCGCKYCGGGGGGKKTQTEINEALGLPNRGPTAITGSSRMRTGIQISTKITRTRDPGASLDTPWIPSVSRKERRIDPAKRISGLNLKLAVNSMRISDLRAIRRYRIGELVWCAWEECSPISSYWPAIISDYSLEPTVTHHTAGRGTYVVLHKRLYSLLRLGAPSEEMCVQFECTRNEDSILPWLAHHVDVDTNFFLQFRPGKMGSILLALHTAKELASVWAVCSRLPIKVPSSLPRATPNGVGHSTSRSSQPNTQSVLRVRPDSHTAPLRSTPPSSIPFLVDIGPPQRSPVRLAPPSPAKRVAASHGTIEALTTSEHSYLDTKIDAVRSQRRQPQPSRLKATSVIETRYEGLWYGAERIWMGDTVRLSPERDAFAQSLQLSFQNSDFPNWQENITPSPGAATRGVLMRIDRIFTRFGEAGSKECTVAGPLYEIAPEGWAEAANTLAPPHLSSTGPDTDYHPWDMHQDPSPKLAGGDDSGSLQHHISFPVPPAPPGYVLRPLLLPGLELPLPASFIAGRYYPRLFPIPQDLSFSSMSEVIESHEAQKLSLCGMVPGRLNHAMCVDVRLANRTQMLEEAARIAKSNYTPIKGGDASLVYLGQDS